MKRQRRQGTREERSSEGAYWRVLGTPRSARTDSRSSRPEFVRSARVWHLWTTCCVYFTGAPPSGRGLIGNDTEISVSYGSIWDLSILMGYRCMRIALWWLLCDGIIWGPLHAVDGSPLYEDPAEVRSADRPCALDMWNTTRSFTHISNTCVIRRWAFLILVRIHLLSCIRSSLYEDPAEVRYASTLCTW